MLDVEVAEQSTGEFNISGGYSTTDGLLAEVKVGESNFFGTGEAVKASVSYGQYAQGVDLSASEPYFLGTRVAAGIDLFGKQTDCQPLPVLWQRHLWRDLVAGHADQRAARHAVALFDLDGRMSRSIRRRSPATPSLPIQQAAAAGPQWVSAVGDTVTYNTLDNNKMPTSGINSQLKQDLAGLGGDVNFLRTTEDVRYYHALNDDLVGMVRAQGGYITGWGGQQVPLIDSFFGGPTMVRGFAPERIRAARSHPGHDHG